MAEVVSLVTERELKKRDEYKRLVLATFDDFEHRDRRAQREVAAKVNQEAREKL